MGCVTTIRQVAHEASLVVEVAPGQKHPDPIIVGWLLSEIAKTEYAVGYRTVLGKQQSEFSNSTLTAQ